MPGQAQKIGISIAPNPLEPGPRRKWVVSTTFWPLFPITQETRWASGLV